LPDARKGPVERRLERGAVDAEAPAARKVDAPYVRIPTPDVPAGPSPWIRLHSKWLDDYRFTRLRDPEKLAILLLWMFSGRNGNLIPNDPAFLSWRLALDGAVDVDALVDAGFLEPATAEAATAPEISLEDAPGDVPSALTPEDGTGPDEPPAGGESSAAALLGRFRRRQPI
jgi:hypothetical protein